jgi:hypothetical protein
MYGNSNFSIFNKAIIYCTAIEHGRHRYSPFE